MCVHTRPRGSGPIKTTKLTTSHPIGITEALATCHRHAWLILIVTYPSNIIKVKASVTSISCNNDAVIFHVDINQLLTDPPTHGPCSKYEITDTATGDHFVGKITLEFEGQPFKVQHSHLSVI